MELPAPIPPQMAAAPISSMVKRVRLVLLNLILPRPSFPNLPLSPCWVWVVWCCLSCAARKSDQFHKRLFPRKARQPAGLSFVKEAGQPRYSRKMIRVVKKIVLAEFPRLASRRGTSPDLEAMSGAVERRRLVTMSLEYTKSVTSDETKNRTTPETGLTLR